MPEAFYLKFYALGRLMTLMHQVTVARPRAGAPFFSLQASRVDQAPKSLAKNPAIPPFFSAGAAAGFGAAGFGAEGAGALA